MPSVTATVISAVEIDLSATAATGGTAPYTYQWYRSDTAVFTPGAGTLIPGATDLTYNDTGLSYYTTYYYKVVATDSTQVSTTSAEVSARTFNRFIYEVLNSAGTVELSETIDLDAQGLLPIPTDGVVVSQQSDGSIRIVVSGGTGYKELVHRNEATGAEDVVSPFIALDTKIFSYALS